MHPFEEIRSRNYSFDDVLRKSIRGVFGPRFWDFAIPAFLVAAVSYAVTMAGSLSQMKRWMETMASAESSGEGSAEILSDLAVLYGQGFILAVVLTIPYIIVVQFVLRRMSVYILEEAEAPSETFRRSLDPYRFLDLVVTGIIATVLFSIAGLFCVLPGLALYPIFALLPAAVVLGEERFRVPIKEPFRLIRGRYWQTVGVLVAIGFAFTLVSLPISFGMSFLFGGSFVSMDPNADFESVWSAYARQIVSPTSIILGAVSVAISVLYALVLGFVTVVMYINYKAIPLAARSNERLRSELQNVYSKERLATRTDLDPGSLEGTYTPTTDDDLVDVYNHIRPDEYPDRFRELLGEIKRRIEGPGDDHVS